MVEKLRFAGNECLSVCPSLSHLYRQLLFSTFPLTLILLKVPSIFPPLRLVLPLSKPCLLLTASSLC